MEAIGILSTAEGMANVVLVVRDIERVGKVFAKMLQHSLELFCTFWKNSLYRLHTVTLILRICGYILHSGINFIFSHANGISSPML